MVAMDARARLGLRLCLPEISVYVESRRSLGMKKCRSCSKFGELAEEVLAEPNGMGGTGGASKPGDSVGDLLVTPGIYAMGMTFDARVRTVDAIEPMDRVDSLASRLSPDWSRFSIPVTL